MTKLRYSCNIYISQKIYIFNKQISDQLCGVRADFYIQLWENNLSLSICKSSYTRTEEKSPIYDNKYVSISKYRREVYVFETITCFF